MLKNSDCSKNILLEDVLNGDSIRDVLKLINGRNYKRLGESDLVTHLSLIEKYLLAEKKPTTKGYGLAFEKLLKKVHDSLKPDDKDESRKYTNKSWRYYVLIEEYIKGTDQDTVAGFLGLARESINRQTRQACNTFADTLYQWELEYRAEFDIKRANESSCHSDDGSESDGEKEIATSDIQPRFRS